MKKQYIVTAVLLVVATGLIAAGVMSGEAVEVARKATTICLECIGVG